MTAPLGVEHLRQLAPQVLAGMVRRHGDFALCEDAVQEALVAASRQWPVDGMPRDPEAWLRTVAERRRIDRVRADAARRRREVRAERLRPAPAAEPGTSPDRDDTLTLLYLCCHPALTVPSQLALMLRAVAGLTTAEIAAAFLVPTATMGQRIARAKDRLRAAGATFLPPDASEEPARRRTVLHALYLLFTEGHAATGGDEVQRVDLIAEAIRLTRLLRAQCAGDPEVDGLLALLLFGHARRAARTTDDGRLVLLADQDRSRWDRRDIDEADAVLCAALARGQVGPYQLEAAIAGVHTTAPSAEATDWAEILALYDLLRRVAPNPVVELNRAVAVAMVHGAAAGLVALEAAAADPVVARGHRLDAARGHLLELAGERVAAAEAFAEAARRTTSTPEQRELERRARELRRSS